MGGAAGEHTSRGQAATEGGKEGVDGTAKRGKKRAGECRGGSAQARAGRRPPTREGRGRGRATGSEGGGAGSTGSEARGGSLRLAERAKRSREVLGDLLDGMEKAEGELNRAMLSVGRRSRRCSMWKRGYPSGATTAPMNSECSRLFADVTGC